MRPIAGRSAAIAALLLTAVPALADVDWFQSPSHNIECSVGFVRGGSDILCRIAEIDGEPTTPRPGSCTGTYGHTFSMLNYGEVTSECGAPQPITAGNQIFPYGEHRDFGGINCTLDTDGLLCTNEDGHGFFLSRARQTVF